MRLRCRHQRAGTQPGQTVRLGERAPDDDVRERQKRRVADQMSLRRSPRRPRRRTRAPCDAARAMLTMSWRGISPPVGLFGLVRKIAAGSSCDGVESLRGRGTRTPARAAPRRRGRRRRRRRRHTCRRPVRPRSLRTAPLRGLFRNALTAVARIPSSRPLVSSRRSGCDTQPSGAGRDDRVVVGIDRDALSGQRLQRLDHPGEQPAVFSLRCSRSASAGCDSAFVLVAHASDLFGELRAAVDSTVADRHRCGMRGEPLGPRQRDTGRRDPAQPCGCEPLDR